MKNITLLLCIALTCCMLACERDIPGSKACPFETVDMDIERVEAFISKATPKAVILTVIGSHHDTYVSLVPDVYHHINGRTITVWATKDYLSEVCLIEKIPPTVAKLGKAIYIGELDAGQYKVVSQSGEELLTFHTADLVPPRVEDCYPYHKLLPPPEDAKPGDCSK